MSKKIEYVSYIGDKPIFQDCVAKVVDNQAVFKSDDDQSYRTTVLDEEGEIFGDLHPTNKATYEAFVKGFKVNDLALPLYNTDAASIIIGFDYKDGDENALIVEYEDGWDHLEAVTTYRAVLKMRIALNKRVATLPKN